jgi:O-antigen biosynthesis protein WbqP
MKRLFDIVIALIGLPFAALVVFVCMAAIRGTSKGPAIFRQVRVGRNEQPFTCYKLRTMYAGTADAPSHETRASAVTPIGKWLRRLKFDELPQLWNVLRGDMSFVGPRPCLPSQTRLIEARRARGLQTIRPGITGVAQVAGIDMSEPERLAEVDAIYLQNMSLGRDLSLMLQTVTGAGRGDAVRQ